MFKIEAVPYGAPDAAARFTRSLRETGFAVLSEHPIAKAQIDDAYAAWADFFASDGKTDYAPKGQGGYFPFRSENAKGVPQKDLKEFYQVYPDTPLPESVAVTTRTLYDTLVKLGGELLGWIEAETPADVAAHFSEPLSTMLQNSDQSMLRVIHYPDQSGMVAEEGAVRAAAHEDINLITLLVAGSAPGLEAQDSSGAWHEVACDPGMIAVNVGDMLQLASGGYYPSTTHRVVNPADGEAGARYSMPLFLHPRPDVALSPDKTAEQYLHERLREIGLVS